MVRNVLVEGVSPARQWNVRSVMGIAWEEEAEG